MKRLSFLLVVLFFVASYALAVTLTATWDASNGADTYRVYATVQGGTPVLLISDLPSTTTPIDVSSLTPGIYTFHVTAVNSFGESGPSNTVVRFIGVPAAPTNFQITY